MSADLVKIVFCVRRRAELSPEEFRDYWRDRHGPLVRSVQDRVPIVRYVQCHTLDGPVTDALRASRGGAEPYDGVAELWFEAGALEHLSPEGIAASIELLEDERTFIDLERSCLFLTEEVEIIAP